MPFTDPFWRAIARYRLMFPDLDSLGVSVVTWLTELDRVGRSAFAAVLLTNSNTGDGSGASGQKNFSQEVLTDALHCRRFELDDTYELPEHLADFESASARRRARRQGSTILLFR